MQTFTLYALYFCLMGVAVAVTAALIDLGLRAFDRWRNR